MGLLLERFDGVPLLVGAVEAVEATVEAVEAAVDVVAAAPFSLKLDDVLVDWCDQLPSLLKMFLLGAAPAVAAPAVALHAVVLPAVSWQYRKESFQSCPKGPFGDTRGKGTKSLWQPCHGDLFQEVTFHQM